MKLYLCGPVSLGGTCTPEQEKNNLEVFHRAERMLKGAGYDVESPAKVLDFYMKKLLYVKLPGGHVCEVEGAAKWQWYMRRTIIQMLTCEAVATIGPVLLSRGCVKEISIAMDFGMPIKSADDWMREEVQRRMGTQLRHEGMM